MVNNFHQRRMAARISQAKLAELVGCNQATISRAEKGLPVNPCTLKLLGEALDKLCAVHKVPGQPVAALLDHPPSAPPQEREAGPPGTETDRERIAELEQTVADLRAELREAHKTINNLSDALAGGLGRAKAYRPPGKHGDRRYAADGGASGVQDGGQDEKEERAGA